MKIVKKLIGLLFVSCGIICMVIAYRQYMTYQKGLDEYEELTEEATSGDDTFDGFGINWKKLKKKNPDIVGWIRMSPDVDYPIMQGKDNSYYLHKGFNKTYNINGSIFMHADNSKDWSDRNTVVYGHNMNNGSMFGNNDYYKEKSYTKKHPCFYIYTEDGRFTYRIFDVMTVKDATAPYQVTFEDDKDFKKYLNTMKKTRSYGMDVKVGSDDMIVTLSTCTNFGKSRFVIQGVMESFKNNDGYEMDISEIKKMKKQKEEEQQLLYDAALPEDPEQDTGTEQEATQPERAVEPEIEEVPAY